MNAQLKASSLAMLIFVLVKLLVNRLGQGDRSPKRVVSVLKKF